MSTLCFSQIGVHSVTVTIFAMRFKLMNPTKVVFARMFEVDCLRFSPQARAGRTGIVSAYDRTMPSRNTSKR